RPTPDHSHEAAGDRHHRHRSSHWKPPGRQAHRYRPHRMVQVVVEGLSPGTPQAVIIDRVGAWPRLPRSGWNMLPAGAGGRASLPARQLGTGELAPLVAPAVPLATIVANWVAETQVSNASWSTF